MIQSIARKVDCSLGTKYYSLSDFIAVERLVELARGSGLVVVCVANTV